VGYVFAMLAVGGSLIAVAAWAIHGRRDDLEIAAFAVAMAVMFLVASRSGFIR
jgi:hypothetical protein